MIAKMQLRMRLLNIMKINSFDEAKDKALEYAGENGDSGNFRVKQCLYCGKYTATVTFK